MSADPTLVAALGADGAWPFAALRIELPEKTLRLLDGAAWIDIGAETFKGEDDDFGTVLALEPISESLDNEAPEFKFVFQPNDAASAAYLANPAMQSSTITVMVGAMNMATGVPIGTPEIVALLEIDVPRLRIGENGVRQVEFTAVSVFERLFAVDEGERATDGFHQSIHPGELGLSMMTGTPEKLWWGANPPSGTTGSYQGVGVRGRFDSWDAAA